MLRAICKYIFVLLFLFTENDCRAFEFADVSEYQEDSLKTKKWKLHCGFDGRMSWALGQRTSLGGIKFGLIYNKKHKFGIGLYYFKNPIIRSGVELSERDYPDATDTTSYNFGYTSLFYEPIWYITRRLSISAPVHFGTATISASYKVDDTTQTVWTNYLNQNEEIFGISGVANYKVFRWLAIGSGGGYRFLLTKDARVRKALNRPIIIFQVKLMLGVMYKLALKKPIDDGWDKK